MQIQIPIELIIVSIIVLGWVEYRAWLLRDEIKDIQKNSEQSAESIKKKIDELKDHYKRYESASDKRIDDLEVQYKRYIGALDEIRDLRADMRNISHHLAVITEFKTLLTPGRPRPWDEIKKEQSIDLKKEG